LTKSSGKSFSIFSALSNFFLSLTDPTVNFLFFGVSPLGVSFLSSPLPAPSPLVNCPPLESPDGA
jgi:hypothetical protein